MKKIISLALVLIMGISFASCGSKNDTKAVEASVDKAVTALKKYDTESINKYVESDDLKSIQEGIDGIEGADKLVKAIFSKLSYEISDVSIKDNHATVSMAVTTKDLKSVASSYMMSMLGSYLKGEVDTKNESFIQEQLTVITDMVNADTVGTTSANVNVALENKDGTWVIILDDTVEDAIMGGAASTIKSIVDLASKNK